MTDPLQYLGLSSKEISIYKALMEFGKLSIADIARHTKLHRHDAYTVLPEMIHKGIVFSITTGKRILYRAAPPSELQRLFSAVEEQVGDEIRRLVESYTPDAVRPKFRFLEGKRGIRFIFHDIVHSLDRGDVFYKYSSRKATKRLDEDTLPKGYRELRDKKQLERFVITSEQLERTKKKRLERSIKIIPTNFDLFEYDAVQLIYKDKIAFIDYASMTALLIESPILASFQKSIFRLLYKFL